MRKATFDSHASAMAYFRPYVKSDRGCPQKAMNDLVELVDQKIKTGEIQIKPVQALEKKRLTL